MSARAWTVMTGLLVTLAMIALLTPAEPQEFLPDPGRAPVTTPAEIPAPAVAVGAIESQPFRPPTHPIAQPATATASNPEFRLTLLSSSGKPESHAFVVIASADEEHVSAHGVTDADGVFRTRAPLPRPGQVIVACAHALPRSFPLEGGPSQRIVVDPGCVLSGRFVMGGSAPARPVKVRVSASRPSRPWGPPVLKLLAQKRRLRLSARSRSDGSFTFRGLPPDWSGRLYFVSPHRLVRAVDSDNARMLPLARPSRDLVIEVTRLPAIRGRVVTADGRPAKNAVWELETRGASGSKQRSPCDAEGKFEALIPDGTTELELGTGVVGGTIERQCKLEGAEVQDLDLGDIELSRTTTMRLRALDVSGNPLRNVIAVLPGNRTALARSDTQGLLTVAAAPTMDSVLVACSGYGPRVVNLPRPCPDPLEVRLSTTPSLTVRCATSASSRRRLRLRVSAPEPILRWPPGAPEEQALHVAGEARPRRSTHHGGTRLEFHFRDGPDVTVSGLRPGIRLHLELLAPSGETLVTRDVTIIPGQRREEILEPRQGPTLRGVVRSRRGQPLGHALVRVLGSDLLRVRTAPDGSFVLPELFGSEVSLLVTAPRHSAHFEKLRPVRRSEPLRITLEPSQQITVQVVDTDGHAVVAEGLEVLLENHPIAHDFRAASEYTFSHLPSSRLTFRLHLDGRSQVFQAREVRDGTVRLVVPPRGRLVLSVPLENGEVAKAILRPRPHDDGPRCTSRPATSTGGRARISVELPAGDYYLFLRVTTAGGERRTPFPPRPVTIPVRDVLEIRF